MTASLLEIIQRIVREELGVLRMTELAVVQEAHPHASDSDQDNYACTVALRDSGLVLKQVPLATPRAGMTSVPAPGDLVLVQFIGGSIDAPVITGSVYHHDDRPPVNAEGQVVWHLPLGAGDDDAVHLELSSAATRELKLALGAGLKLTLRDDDPAVKLDVDGGKATVTIDRDGAIHLESTGSIEIKAQEITVEAQGGLTLKGATVNIN